MAINQVGQSYKVYERDELFELKAYAFVNRRYLRIDTTTWILLSKLGIRERIRGNRGKQLEKNKSNRPKQSGPHSDLLLKVPTIATTRHSESNIKLMTVNTRSIRNKFLAYIEDLNTNDVDLCVVTETWLNDQRDVDILASLNDNGYTFKSYPRPDKGGGIGISYKSNLDITAQGDGMLKTFQYASWRLVEKSSSMKIIGIYHPPPSENNRHTDQQFILEFADWINLEIATDQNVVILGDFNIHMTKHTSEPEMLRSLLTSLNLVNYVNFPTHISGNALDLVITYSDQKHQVTKCIQGTLTSDHYAVEFAVSLKSKPLGTEVVTSRPWKNLLEGKSGSSIRSLIDSCLQLNEIDQIVTTLDQGLNSIVNEIAPQKTTKVKTRPKMPWFTSHSKTLKKYVRQCERHWKLYQTVQDWITYKNVRNFYHVHLTISKRNVIQNIIKDNAGDTKKLFEIVNNLTFNTKSNPLPRDIPDDEMPGMFANFFLDKIEKIREGLKDIEPYRPTERAINSKLCAFKEINLDQTKQIVKSLKRKSSELDPLPAKYSLAYGEDFLPLYQHIINISFKQSKFPDTWKCALVKPLLKNSKLPLEPKNYRPVSNLSYTSKLLEKAALSQLVDHMDSNAQLPSYQSAYRVSHSCETALMVLHNDLCWNMENQLVTSFCAMDLSAAFDTVDHRILLQVMESSFGVCDEAKNWIETYLCPRQFCVTTKNIKSEPLPITFSVPQGSCLGPQLFLCYASTLEEVVKSESQVLSGFADDHGLRSAFNPNVDGAEVSNIKDLESTLNDIKHWMDSNVLKMNSSKTEYIQFGTKRQLEKCTQNSLTVNGESVAKSESIKLLGVLLDSSMTMKAQIDSACAKASRSLYKIRLLRKSLDMESTKILVSSTVITHLDYANALYIGLPKCDIHKLQRIQNQAAKLVLCRCKMESSSKARYDLHWLDVQHRIDYKVLTTVHRSIHGKAPVYLQNLFTMKSQNYSLRSTGKKLLDIPKTKRKTLADRSLQVYGSKLWNSLPEYIASISNFDEFKALVKTYLFEDNYSEIISELNHHKLASHIK